MKTENLKTFSQMQSDLANFGKVGLEPLKISVLRNITIESIAVPLKYFSAKLGYDAQITWGGFDTLIQDASNSILINDETDLILIYAHLWMSLPAISERFCQLSIQEKQQEVDFFLQTTENMLNIMTSLAPKAHIIWHDFELPLNPSYGIADNYLTYGQTNFIKEINKQLYQLFEKYNSVSYLSSELVLRRIGVANFYDWRYWFSAKAPYSKETLLEMAKQSISLFQIQHNAAKKCLVLDCDNTLWGGIIGEDGISGIQLSRSYPGNTFYAFQAAIVELYHRGVLIALCSKNNSDDVWSVFDNHPDMLLKKSHIAIAKINWNDKSSNLLEIAEELNISIDSIVFIDDSQFEIEQIKHQLPQVTTIRLDTKMSSNYANNLKSLTCFDTWKQTDEDKLRGQMYQSQRERQKFKQQGSLAEYLVGLNMRLKVKVACEIDIPRIAQQTQKTNQFNLTTKRYSEGHIKQLITSNDYLIITGSLEDRFGDMGLVASAIIRITSNNRAELDTFLLSCRAIGRKVEYSFLKQIFKICKAKGITELLGIRIATEKNAQTSDFYSKSGFIQISSTDVSSQKFLCSDLDKDIAPPFIFITEENE